MRITVMCTYFHNCTKLALVHCSARSLPPVSIVCLISLHFMMSK